MKKLILTMMSITIVVASYAHQNPFEKSRTQKKNSAKLLAMNPMSKINATNINVPTLTKYSYWDNSTTNWSPYNSIRTSYLNNRITSELQLSYNLLDTVSKTFYTYDNQNRISKLELKTFDPNSHSFQNNARTNYYYSNYGSFMMLNENYNMGTNTWTPNYRTIIIYDFNFNQIKQLDESYQNGSWQVNYSRASNISYYNNTKKILESIDSSYNQSTMMMEAVYKTNKTYNGSGLVQSILNYYYNNNVAELTEVDSVKYDNMGIPVSLTFHEPINMIPMFMIHDINWAGGFNSTIDLFENQPASYLQSVNMNNTWALAGRFTTLHPDNYGSIIFFDEEYENNAFFPSYRRSQLNDSHLNGIEESEEDYDTSTNIWITRYGYKNIYQYDMSGNMTENITQYYESMDTAYLNSQKIETSEFISIVAGVNSTKTLETKLYPNPSSNGSVSINLNLEKSSAITIEVIDLNGRIISSQQADYGQGLNTIQLDGLTQGLYFVVISSDYGVSRTKLIVK